MYRIPSESLLHTYVLPNFCTKSTFWDQVWSLDFQHTCALMLAEYHYVGQFLVDEISSKIEQIRIMRGSCRLVPVEEKVSIYRFCTESRVTQTHYMHFKVIHQTKTDHGHIIMATIYFSMVYFLFINFFPTFQFQSNHPFLLHIFL